MVNLLSIEAASGSMPAMTLEPVPYGAMSDQVRRRTQRTVEVEAFARRDRSGEAIKVTGGVFTYVAVNAESKPAGVIWFDRLGLG